jgi:hypothetical protein
MNHHDVEMEDLIKRMRWYKEGSDALYDNNVYQWHYDGENILALDDEGNSLGSPVAFNLYDNDADFITACYSRVPQILDFAQEAIEFRKTHVSTLC